MAKAARDQVVIEPRKDTQPRHEIRDLLTIRELRWQRDLFMQAFSALQALPHDDPRGFFQIAGIHGVPYTPYDRVGDAQVDGSDWGGYCRHNSQLFPTWHRPYMMLIEQALREAADRLIGEWEGTSADEKGRNAEAHATFDTYLKSFKEAADQLRFPYLDWANISSLQYGLPDDICMAAEVTVINLVHGDPQKGYKMNIPNPLKAVVVQKDLGDVQTSSDIFNPMSRPKYQVPSMSYPYTPKGYATVRYPDNNYESQAYDLQYNMLQSVSLKFRPRLSKMFAVGNWREFSNHTTGTASLEGVHDQVHDTLGGNGGHMGYPEVAAFDPIFFLHHANVDRLLALWQVVYDDPSNPATWIQPEEEKAGTFTFPDGTTTDENTPLTPFRKREQLEDEAGNIDQSDMGAFYTSKGVRSLEHLGYTYPELIEWQAAGLTQAEMLTKINQIYSPSLDYTEGYRLHVNFKGIAKRRLNGPFSINVFVGYDKSDYVVDASTPTKDNPYFAGSVSVFASSNAASNKCANCRHPDRQQVCGSVDLTSALLKVGPVKPAELVEDKSDADSRQPWTWRPKLITAETELTWDDLEGKLKDNIQWVAVKPNGAQIHHVAVKDISVTWTRPYNLTEDEQDALIGPCLANQCSCLRPWQTTWLRRMKLARRPGAVRFCSPQNK